MVAFGEEIQLVVPEQARDVEITRPDARPAVIDQQRLGMQHRALPLEDAGTRTQQIAVADPRGIPQDGEVARAGDEQAHVHPGPCGVDQAGVQRRRGDQIRVGDPQTVRRARGQELDSAVHARPARHARQDARRRGPTFHGIGFQLVGRERRAGAPPDAGERVVERRGGGSGDGHHGVAPRPAPARGVSRPLVADAQPAGHRPTAVGDEQLAVITGEYVERVAGEERVEGAHLDAGLGEPSPVAPRGAERAEGIVQDTHPDSGAGPLDQRVGEAPTGRVVADDVVLEVHPAARRGDRGEHRVQGARAVGVVLEAIAVDGPGARRAVDGEGERVAGGGRGGGGNAHPTAACPPRPSSTSAGRSARITKAMCSSNGTPSSAAP